MIEANTTSNKIPSVLALANRACAVYAIFILPILGLKLPAESSYCSESILTILPRFSHLLDSDIASRSGICTYQVSCILIFISRVVFTAMFARILFDQSFNKIDPGRLKLLPTAIQLYLACSAVLFIVLLTTFEWGGRREDIK
jgi:hypothetical protein